MKKAGFYNHNGKVYKLQGLNIYMITQESVKKWLLAIGIAIVFTMFINYSASTFFNEPVYEKYCANNNTVINWTQNECVEQGGQ